ncbi:MAG: type II secretion system GspH family protein [Patescibacteria group bacterium]|nr:type II secretion system GspH family protein [Patescibacteria group bacterium]
MTKSNLQLSTFNFQLIRGFTLIEMLVTIAIIVIVSGALIVGINPTKRLQDAQDARAKQDVRAIASAVESCMSYVNPATNTANSNDPNTNCSPGSKLAPGSTTPGSPFTRAAPPSNIIFLTSISNTNVCFYEQGSTNPANYWVYQTNTGLVQSQSTVPNSCP